MVVGIHRRLRYVGTDLQYALVQCRGKPGITQITLADLQHLIDLRQSSNATCVALVPWHPVFCRDATDLYLNWDFMHIMVPWVPAAEKQKYIAMWRRAVAEIQNKKPTLVMGNKNFLSWDDACRHGIVSQDQHYRLLRFLQIHYREVPIDASGKVMFVRKEPLDLP